MGRPAAINRPLSKLIKKKQTGCRSMKNKKKRAKIAKKRKVMWKKYILPKMDIDDMSPQPPSNKRQPPPKRPLTGKQQRKLRKKMKRLTKPDEDRMEGMKTSKVVEISQKAEEEAEDKPEKVPESSNKVDENAEDDDDQWEDMGDWEDVEMKQDD